MPIYRAHRRFIGRGSHPRISRTHHLGSVERKKRHKPTIIDYLTAWRFKPPKTLVSLLLARVLGFEPRNNGSKDRRLTAWPHPTMNWLHRPVYLSWETSDFPDNRRPSPYSICTYFRPSPYLCQETIRCGSELALNEVNGVTRVPCHAERSEASRLRVTRVPCHAERSEASRRPTHPEVTGY